MKDKIYYFSNDDNQIHNINDIDRYNKKEDTVQILDNEGFVIDECILHTFNEIVNILKSK